MLNPSTAGKIRSDRALVRMVLYFAVAAAGGAAALGYWYAGPSPVAYDLEHSWVQIVQGTCYVIGLVMMVLTARGLRREGRGEWTVIAALGMGIFFLAMREIEPDNHLFDVHMFSLMFLFKEEIPLAVKLGMGTVSIVILAGAAWWAWGHRKLLGRHFKSVVRKRWVGVLVAAGALLACSQFIDRADSWKRRFALELPGLYEPEKRSLRNVEETMELIGAILVLCSVVELRINLRRVSGKPSPPLEDA